MDQQAPSAGLLSLSNELLFYIAYELKDPLAIHNASLVCRSLRDVFQQALMSHIETLYEANDHLYHLLERIRILTLETPATPTTPIRDRLNLVTSQILSLKIARDRHYVKHGWARDIPLMTGIERLFFYQDLIDTAGTFSDLQKHSWLRNVLVKKDSALLSILFSMLPRLHTLEIEETLAMLPRKEFFVRTGAFQNLSNLKLSGLSEEPLTAAFYGLIALPNLCELEFSDMYMDAKIVAKVPQTPLNVTTLRFIHCYVSIGVLNKFIQVCPSLEAFAYELGRAHWNDKHSSADFKAPTIKDALLPRQDTLKSITILNMQVPGIRRIYAMGSLCKFTALEHLCVNQPFLMPTLRNGDRDLPPHKDLGYYLLNLPPTVKVLELYYCMEYTFSALDRLAKRLAAQPTQLKLIKARFTYLVDGPLPWLPWIQRDWLEQTFEAVGVTLRTCVVLANFEQ